MFLSDSQVKMLEYEIVSQDLRIRLTRELLHQSDSAEYAESIIAIKNRLINLSRTISGKKIYVLVADDDGYYDHVEYNWHDSNFYLIFRTLSTTEFIEYVAELIRLGYFSEENINELLEKENASYRFKKIGKRIEIEVFPVITEFESKLVKSFHPNIRSLINRMDTAFNNKDYSNVLHSSASIFETMAKEIVGISTIQDQTLKSFFDRYRKDSKLPKALLDFILEIYERRNIEPLAAHGSLLKSKITRSNALLICEMTKAFVKIEHQLRLAEK